MKFSKESPVNTLNEDKTYNGTIFDISKVKNSDYYDVKIKPWLDEGISQQALDNAEIGYYPGDAQITIPHFDKNGRFIGLRGRTLVKEEAELYGKYRPMKVNGQMYNHPWFEFV